jgi:hypothetical protein
MSLRPTPECDEHAIPFTFSSGKTYRVILYETAQGFEAQRDELQEKYDKLATENMLEVNKICNQRDAAIEALMKIEDIFIDGDDTYEDWKSMGQIARTFFEKTYESGINQNN